MNHEFRPSYRFGKKGYWKVFVVNGHMPYSSSNSLIMFAIFLL